RDAGHGVSLPVQRVDRTGKPRVNEISHDRVSDAPRPSGRAEDCDAARVEEVGQRCNGPRVVAVVDPCPQRLRARYREDELDRRIVPLAVDLESGIPEDVEHAVVVGAHLCDEPADARGHRDLGELFEKACSNAAAVQGSSTRKATSAISGSRSRSYVPIATTRPSRTPISAPRASPSASRYPAI